MRCQHPGRHSYAGAACHTSRSGFDEIISARSNVIRSLNGGNDALMAVAKLQIFISWAGDQAETIGKGFRDFLPDVVNMVEPFISGSDIDKGLAPVFASD